MSSTMIQNISNQPNTSGFRRILIVASSLGSLNSNDITDGYLRFFKGLGMSQFDYLSSYTAGGQAGMEKKLTELVTSLGIDCIFFFEPCDGFCFRLDYLENLRKSVFLVLFMGDCEHYFYARDAYYAQVANLVVVYDAYSRYAFKKMGVDAISFFSSYDGTVYRPQPEVTRDISVSFVGNLHGNSSRREYLEQLRNAGITVQTFGAGSPGGQLSLEGMIDVFNRSKINLSFSRTVECNAFGSQLKLTSRATQLKGRMMETALCRSFCLTENAAGLDEVFDPETEIGVFNSIDDLPEKVRFYLENEEVRERIASQAYTRATHDYENSAAIPRLLNLIAEKRSEKHETHLPIRVDSPFLKNYKSTRVIWCLRFLLNRKFILAKNEFSQSIGPFHVHYTLRHLSEYIKPVRQLKSVWRRVRDVK